MSHELRTPLNGIIGFAEFLVDGKPGVINPKQKQYLQDILDSGKRLLQLVDNALNLTDLKANKIALNPQRFSLRKAIEEVNTMAKSIAEKKRIHLAVDVAPELDDVTLDQQRFKEVLYNLLSNAIKFTNDGGKVEIRAAPLDAHHFKVAVKDTRPGIKPQDIPRVFMAFEQVEVGLSRPLRRLRTWADTGPENCGIARRHNRRGKRSRNGKLLHVCATAGTGGNQRLIPDSSHPPTEWPGAFVP